MKFKKVLFTNIKQEKTLEDITFVVRQCIINTIINVIRSGKTTTIILL
jgi:hypothetical protein